ncbi:hypothetical protein [Granulicoccus phenolivorans]|uniref:hypothetical protein n=1 Tax=Granulicoccus phenolivorans TaxID=266854 RepID=UPI00047CC6CD|nr:hypothetical protein [Granulicoccus phenolivorans]
MIARAVTVAAVIVVLAVTGCTKGPDGSSPTAPAGSAGQSADPGSAADPTAAREAAPEGARFTFDQAARWPDGVEVQVTTITARTATATERGAEGTDGHLVEADIQVSNGSDQPFDTAQVAVWGYYDRVGAPKVSDSSGRLGVRLAGVLQPGETGQVPMGFAIPADRLGAVTVMIVGDSAHPAVQFSGAVSAG